jgi:hypothetical protein
MNTRTNISSVICSALTMVGAAAAVASPATAQTRYVNTEVPVVAEKSGSAELGMGGGIKLNTLDPDAGVQTKGGWIDPRVQIADYDHNGKVDDLDLYEFFVAWNDGKVTADINGDGFIDAADVWFYLEIWNSVITTPAGTGS